MKKAILFIGSIAVVLVASCTKHDNDSLKGSEDAGTVTIRVSMPEDSDSKVSFTADNDYLRTAWEETDQLRIISGDQSAVYTVSKIVSRQVAEFTGPAVEGTSFDILYPGTYASVAEAEADTASPAQDGNGSTAHLRFRALLSGIDGYETISFQDAWAGEHGGSLKLGTAIKLIARMPDGVTTLKEVKFDLGGKLFTLPLTGVDVSGADQILTAYMMLPWENISLPNGTVVTISVTGTDDKEYSVSFPVDGDRVVTMGKVNIFGSTTSVINEKSNEVVITDTLPDFTQNPIVDEY